MRHRDDNVAVHQVGRCEFDVFDGLLIAVLADQDGLETALHGGIAHWQDAAQHATRIRAPRQDDGESVSPNWMGAPWPPSIRTPPRITVLPRIIVATAQ